MLRSAFITRRWGLENASIRQRLQKAWWSACLLCVLFTMGSFSCLYLIWQPHSALKWIFPATGVNAYVLWLLWTALDKNHHPRQKVLRPYLGYANWLTIGRGFLIGALAGFLFQGPPMTAASPGWLVWTPGIIYITAALLDYLDGYLARITRSETRLGEWLDSKIDALGLLVAPILAVAHNRLPIYYLSVSVAYYLFQFGIWYRKKNNKPVIEPEPHPAKRMIAGFQMGLVAIALIPLFSLPAITIAAIIFMVPLLAGFLKDGFHICGYLEDDHFQQTRRDRHIDLVLTKLFPVFLRLIVGGVVIFLFHDAGASVVAGKQIFAVARLEASLPFDLPLLPVAAAAGLMITLGFMARSAALLLSLLVAGTLTVWDAPFSLFLLLSCTLTLMLTGSGMLSLWQPENKLLLERQGAAHR